MSQLFNCPSCGASLDYDGGDHATVRCSYCGNTVVVPETMRSRSATVTGLFSRSNQLTEIINLINNGNHTEAVDLYSRTFGVSHEEAHAAVGRLASGLSLAANHVSVQSYSISSDPNIQTYRSSDNTGRTIGCLVGGILLITIAIILVTTIVPIIASGAALSSIFSSDDPFEQVGQILSTVEASGITTDPGSTGVSGRTDPGKPDATPTPGTADLLLNFGTEGIAPGQLNDARTLAVAPDGNIYVADRDSGRLQVFNPQGQVQTQWQMDKDRFIDSMTIDRSGHLYTVESSDIYQYDLATGQMIKQLQYTGTIASFNSVAATADNQVVAVNWIAGEVVRFDPNGTINLTIHVEDVADASGFDFATVDGSGNIYVVGTGEDILGDRQDVVFKFNAEGQYVTRFGQSGNEPGSFRAPEAIVVDGQGRIYVGDVFGVDIFDNNGTYLNNFDIEGVVFDMKFNDQGDLLITNRTTVYKYHLNLQ
ncbi:MAG: NHL repeat-containing protein [Candidatus Promineifilaceae bacterium]